jgi:hypothetical protein
VQSASTLVVHDHRRGGEEIETESQEHRYLFHGDLPRCQQPETFQSPVYPDPLTAAMPAANAKVWARIAKFLFIGKKSTKTSSGPL